MTPERWQQVDKLLERVLEEHPDRRQSFLDQACAGDEDLRREIETLLAHEKGGSFLSSPAVEVAAQMISPNKSDSLVGQQLGSYQILSLLGTGGMGEVYKARDTRLNRAVAIKVLPPHLSGNVDRRRRFSQEARAASALNHPNIITIHDIASDDGRDFIVMEYAEGKTLSQMIPRRGMKLNEVLNYGIQIADALAKAHAAGIVHRDLKPSNVMVTEDALVKVLDFGLAKLTELQRVAEEDEMAVSTREVTEPGMILGTVTYMSPEQAEGKRIDARSDIFSFGSVLYEMTTGRRAFQGDSNMSTLAAIIHKEPEPLSGHVPPALRMIVEKALEKNPPDRYQSMSEMVVDFRRLIKRPQPIAAEATRRPRGRFLIWVGVIALAAMGAWMIRRPSPAPQNPLASARFTRLTDFDGAENGATISPDGKFVVFRSDRDGQFDLFMTQIGTGRFVNLTQGKVNVLRGPVRSVGFGADGTEIWLMGTNFGSRLELMPLLGGPLRPFLSDRVVNIAWSPDGSRLAYHTFDAGDPTFLADRTGANPKQIFRNPILDGRGHNHYPIFSPDGRWLYFVSGIWTTFEMDLWRVPATGGTAERLTHHSSDVTYPTPIDNETILYVSPAEDGSGPWLWAFDVNQRTSQRVSFGLEKYFSLAASADGRRAVATVANPTAALWSMPILESMVGEGGVKPYPLPTVRALAPRFNGESLLYLSSSGAGDGLWRYEKGQALEIWKGANESLLDPPGVSPDGRRATLVLKRESKRRLHLISVDGAEPPQAFAESIDVRGSAGWSPDGKWIITGGDDSKGPGLFKIPVEDGDPVRLVSAPAFNPVWSPAGDLILYTGSLGAPWVPMLAVRPDGTSVELPEIRLRQDGERLRFLPDGKRLVYMQGSNPWQDFWMLDLTTKKTRQLSRLDNRAAMRTFDITPDGKHIVFDRLRENSDVVLIDLAR